MGMLSRFKDIISANINALIDKCEDPEKMIDQYLRNLADDLAEVKKETAAVMADEEKARRAWEANQSDVAKYTNLAKKALQAGNEGDAKIFIKKKQELESVGESLKQVYDVAAANSAKMRQMHDKLVSDISTLNSRKDAIKAKVKIAKAQEKVNEVGSSLTNAQDSMNAFSRMEEKANRMLDQANAMSQLNSQPADEAIAAEAKYKDAAAGSQVDDELEAMKKELGL